MIVLTEELKKELIEALNNTLYMVKQERENKTQNDNFWQERYFTEVEFCERVFGLHTAAHKWKTIEVDK